MYDLNRYSPEDLNNLSIVEPHLGTEFTQLIDGEDIPREKMEEIAESEALSALIKYDNETW